MVQLRSLHHQPYCLLQLIQTESSLSKCLSFFMLIYVYRQELPASCHFLRICHIYHHNRDDNSQKPEDLPLTLIRITHTDSTGNNRSSTTCSYTQSAWDMENSFTVKKEHKGRLLERTVSVLSKAHFLQKDSKLPFSWHPDVVLYKVGTQSSVLINQVSLFRRRPTAVCILSKGSLL